MILSFFGLLSGGFSQTGAKGGSLKHVPNGEVPTAFECVYGLLYHMFLDTSLEVAHINPYELEEGFKMARFFEIRCCRAEME